MKNKKTSGFTLVECIVAIAILSIGTLVMASIYSCVARINEKTFRANESLSQTVQRVEMKTDVSAPTPGYTKITGSSGTQVTYTKLDSAGAETTKAYKMQSTVVVAYSKDSKSHENKEYSNANNDPIDLHYKYFSSPTP